MNVSLTARIYTKGESRGAVTKTILSRVHFADALFAIDPILNTLCLTGWTLTNCTLETAKFLYKDGWELENYSGEKMTIKMKELKK